MQARVGTIVKFFAVLVVAALIIGTRRYHQVLVPQVWAEDGAIVLPAFIKDGWTSLFYPVQGYLILASKLTSFISAAISFPYYPEISTFLAILAQAACVAIIAVAPTYLPWRIACALAVVLVPSGTEVFATPLYMMWWVGLFPFLTLIWLPGRAQVNRAVLLLLGGLSSPSVLFAAPLFVLRALMTKERTEYIIAAIAVSCAAAQAVLIRLTNPAAASPSDALSQPVVVIGKYFGSAMPEWPVTHSVFLGLAMIAVLSSGLVSVKPNHRTGYFLLGLAACAAVVSSAIRVNPTLPQPMWAGPRYFFYPMILMLWMLIWIMAQSHYRGLTIAAAMLIGLYLPNLKDGFYQPKPNATDWRRQLTLCAKGSGIHQIDVQIDAKQTYWKMPITSDDCKRMLRWDYSQAEGSGTITHRNIRN